MLFENIQVYSASSYEKSIITKTTIGNEIRRDWAGECWEELESVILKITNVRDNIDWGSKTYYFVYNYNLIDERMSDSYNWIIKFRAEEVKRYFFKNSPYRVFENVTYFDKEVLEN